MFGLLQMLMGVEAGNGSRQELIELYWKGKVVNVEEYQFVQEA